MRLEGQNAECATSCGSKLSKAGIYRDGSDPRIGEVCRRAEVAIHFDCAEQLYAHWPSPTCIISDGPYGVSGFPGDEHRWNSLAEWYEPHVKAWSQQATPQTTLWFWNTEVGWAMVHPLLIKHGWEYRCCNIWDKGMSHVAGNANTQTSIPAATRAMWSGSRSAACVLAPSCRTVLGGNMSPRRSCPSSTWPQRNGWHSHDSGRRGMVQTQITRQGWLGSTPAGRRAEIRGWRAGGSLAVASSNPATPLFFPRRSVS